MEKVASSIWLHAWLGYRKLRDRLVTISQCATGKRQSRCHGLIGIPITGGPPVTGTKRLPPTGMPMRGAPPVAGTIKRGPMFSSCGGNNVVTAEVDLA